ncbi:MAG: HNH endonuclease, partial [Acidimicrobiales bacterium]
KELHARQMESRRIRHWRDSLGMVRIEGALPPQEGIPFVTRIEREAQRLRRGVAEGSKEPFERDAADALVELMKGVGTDARGKPRTWRADLVFVCDLRAFRRGYAEEGEPCHVVGGGPVPVDLAKEVFDDAFVKCVLHDGTCITHVSHPGRKKSAALDSAVWLGAPPGFDGRRCADCGRAYGLENDHVDPIAHTGPTSYDNLAPRCFSCHAAKTERDRKAGLLGRDPPRRRPARSAGPSRRPVPGEAPTCREVDPRRGTRSGP